MPDFEEIEKPFLNKIIDQKKIEFEAGIVNKIEFGANYKGYVDFTYYNEKDDLGTSYPFSIEPYIHSYFGDNKNQIRVAFMPTKDVSEYESRVGAMITDLYYIRKFNENHEVLIGNSRVPIGFEGGLGNYALPFVQRSQIANNFGNARALGIRFRGNINKFDYDLGTYSSTRYLQHLNDGGEFVGWLGYSPFKDKENYFKNLKLGAGLNYGRQGENYTVLSTGVQWDYKKVFASAEYGFAQNYNGSSGYKSGKAQGVNATLGYNLTDKLQVLARYDIFDPHMSIDNNSIKQYTAGINYFVIGQRLRFTLNYIFEQQNNNNKNKIMFLTQILI
ncbi:MAG: hypothetical protein E7Z91_00535 [Cyanobacteria bacterium SIG30]|nr:hypothetical protein [Cyanobacteria bacterium SIG30]